MDSSEAVQITNLVANSSFKRWKDGIPTSWIIGNHLGNVNWDDGLCTAGPDNFVGVSGTAARLTCFWFGQQPDKEPGRYGLWLWFEADSDHVETNTRFRLTKNMRLAWPIVQITFPMEWYTSLCQVCSILM